MNSGGKRVAFVEQFYWPDGWGGAQIPRDLTSGLARNGWSVEVLCGSEQYIQIAGAEGEDPRKVGVRIRRVPRLLPGDIHRSKIIRQLWFYIAALPLLLFRRPPDVYVAQTNPPLAVCLVALFAHIQRRPYIIIAQDIYPEVMFAHGMSKRDGLIGRLLTRILAWAYRRAARVVALGEVMAERLGHKGVPAKRIEIISNWATGNTEVQRGNDNGLRRDWDLVDRFVLLYSGNLGFAHDVETPIAALRLLLERSPQTRLVFVGKGSRLAEARRAAQGAILAQAVQFHPWVPAEQLPQSLGLANIALVTLRQGFEGLVVPSKLLGYMARGIPTIYIGPHSDAERVLIASGGGRCFQNGDADGVAAEVHDLIEHPERLVEMGKAAANYYDTHLHRSKGLERYTELIDSVVSASAALRTS